ncbi:TPA: ABC-three component system middle component 5 [Photobacterium damselae]
MLIYHPAQDINHCVFRLLSIIENTNHQIIKIDTYRLIDFYTLFPYLISLIKPLPRPLNQYKKVFSNISEPFEALKNTCRILFELENLQSVAIQNLLAKGILDKEYFDKGFIKRTNYTLPPLLSEELSNSTLAKEEWFKALINALPSVKFEGKTGLKARTGLMEYRYDLETK